jgi:hypothetical protein
VRFSSGPTIAEPPPKHHAHPARRFTRIKKEAGIAKGSGAGGLGGGSDGNGDDADDAAAGAAAAGGGLASLLDELLEGDFDPEAYDRRMAAAFGDEYYEVCVGGQGQGEAARQARQSGDRC